MYSLVSGFIEHYFRKTDHRALIVGLDGVGKTVRSFRSFNRKWKSAFSARLNFLSLNNSPTPLPHADTRQCDQVCRQSDARTDVIQVFPDDWYEWYVFVCASCCQC